MELLRPLLDDPKNIGESRRANVCLLEDTDSGINNRLLAIGWRLSTNDLDQRTHQLFLALVSRLHYLLGFADIPSSTQHLCRFTSVPSIKWIQPGFSVSDGNDLSAQCVDDVGVFAFDVSNNHRMNTECLTPRTILLISEDFPKPFRPRTMADGAEISPF